MASAALWPFTVQPSVWPLPVPLLCSWRTPLTWKSPPRSCPATSTWPRSAQLSKHWTGTDCLLIARSNADPADPEQMKEGCERLQEAIDLGKERGMYVLAMMVLVGNAEQAAEMAKIVTGPKIFADVRAYKGEDGHYHPSVTMDELTPLGFKMCSSHYTMKAAMEGMLEHGMANFKDQSVAYSFETAPASRHRELLRFRYVGPAGLPGPGEQVHRWR